MRHFRKKKTTQGKPRSRKVHSGNQKATVAEASWATMDREMLKMKQIMP